MTDSATTAISQIHPDRVLVRGYNLVDMAGKYTFGDVVYLLMTGELPADQEGQMLEAMLVICAEHSINAPCTQAARTVASCGVPTQCAIAAGISAIGEYHGGAGEACAKMLQDALHEHPERDPEWLAAHIVAEFRRAGQRIPGFGHRFHNPDPRAERLLALADAWSISGPHVVLASAIEIEMEKATQRTLPLNVDGAQAAILSDMGIDWQYAKAVFILGRTAGLAAHVHEELTTGSPLKFAGKREIEYVGPPERQVPTRGASEDNR